MLMKLRADCEADDPDMARKSLKPLNTIDIDRYHKRLKAATCDRKVFSQVLDELANDRSISAADVVELARLFTLGYRAASKKAAILAIGQERVRLSNAEATAASAARAKTWL